MSGAFTLTVLILSIGRKEARSSWRARRAPRCFNPSMDGKEVGMVHEKRRRLIRFNPSMDGKEADGDRRASFEQLVSFNPSMDGKEEHNVSARVFPSRPF